MNHNNSTFSEVAAAIIPARYDSKRLPGKSLLNETGKYLIEHVYDQVCLAQTVDTTIIATDDPRIAEAAQSFGAQVVLTSSDHPSGTDRIAEVARQLDHDIILNVQGDEPEMSPEAIDQLTGMLLASPEIKMATLAYPIRTVEEFEDPNVVKVVVDNQNNALYFSRAPIPYQRGESSQKFDQPSPAFHHIGIYGFRKSFLLDFITWPPGKLEQLERLEQLRALEHGFNIQVGLIEFGACGIDSLETYHAFVRRWTASQEK